MRGYIRELEKEVKSLRRQVRQYEKYDRTVQSSDEKLNDSEDTKPDLKRTKNCPSCEKHKMVETLDLGAKGVYGECICGFKGKMV